MQRKITNKKKKITGFLASGLISIALASSPLWAENVEVSQNFERQRPAASKKAPETRKPLPNSVKNRAPRIIKDHSTGFIPVPDRWRLIETICRWFFFESRWSGNRRTGHQRWVGYRRSGTAFWKHGAFEKIITVIDLVKSSQRKSGLWTHNPGNAGSTASPRPVRFST